MRIHARHGPRGLATLTVSTFLLFVVVMAGSPGAEAVHLFNGCARTLEPVPDGGGAVVHVFDDSFHDASGGGTVTRIASGGSVTWVWESTFCHSGTEGAPRWHPFFPTDPVPARAFDSGLQEPTPSGASFTVTFDAPGAFYYFCEHHVPLGMQGVVIVERSPARWRGRPVENERRGPHAATSGRRFSSAAWRASP